MLPYLWFLEKRVWFASTCRIGGPGSAGGIILLWLLCEGCVVKERDNWYGTSVRDPTTKSDTNSSRNFSATARGAKHATSETIQRPQSE